MLPKLSLRLQTIYNLVDKNSKTVDIGCDHGLLSIALSKNNIITSGIASDVLKTALTNTINNIDKYQVTNLIPILANGTNIPNIDNYDTFILSGMGTNNIISILKRDINILPNTLIICSNNNYYLLRKEINKLGYTINKETLIKDDNIYYIAIKFIKNKTKYKYSTLLTGLLDKNNLYFEYLNYLININQKNLNRIPARYILKKLKIKKDISIYKNKLN